MTSDNAHLAADSKWAPRASLQHLAAMRYIAGLQRAPKRHRFGPVVPSLL